jgi:hypothetical protein
VKLLVLIEKKTVAGSAVQDVTFASLNGDVDELYILIYRVKNAYNGVMNLSLQPNGLTTNQTSYYHIYTSGHGVGGGAGSWGLNYLTALNAYGYGKVWIFAKTGQYRSYLQHGYRTGDQGGLHQMGDWSDTSTNITSLVIHSDRAGGIAVNSTFELYRVVE